MNDPGFFKAECPFCGQPVEVPETVGTDWITCPSETCGKSFQFANVEVQAAPPQLPSLPQGAVIESGVLRVGGQTIFLKNVTSTRIDKIMQARHYKGIGVSLFICGLFAGVGCIFAGGIIAVIGLALIVSAVLALQHFSYVPEYYTLIIVTAAGESKILSGIEYGPLRELEDAVAQEIVRI